MPPKSSNKKQAAPSWYHCEACDVDITSNEREKHEQLCPIDESCADESAEFIRAGCLNTSSVERRCFNVEELKNMPDKYLENIIFLSEGAIRLAKFHIGQQVVINLRIPGSHAPLIRTVWPVPEKFLTTVFVTEEDFHKNWQPFKGQALKIQLLDNQYLHYCKTVILEIIKCNTIDIATEEDEEQLSQQQLIDIARMLKLHLKNMIFTMDSIVKFNFFNKALTLKVISWTKTMQADSSLEQALNQLSITDSRHAEYCKIAISTHVELKNTVYDTVTAQDVISTDCITKLDIGGLNKQMMLIEEAMKYAMSLTAVPSGLKISRGFIIYGPSGCGKSLLCDAFSSWVKNKTEITSNAVLRINSSEIFSKFLGETEKNLLNFFDKACGNYPKPTLIIIEDIHNLCPRHETSEVIKRVSASFVSMLDSLTNRPEAKRIFVLATTSQIDAVNPSLRRCGRFDMEVEIGVPSPRDREEILNCLLRKLQRYDISAAELNEIASVTHGFVGADLASLVYTASLKAVKANETLKLQHLQLSLLEVKPSAMREVHIESPNVHWSDIGGQDELKLKLKQAIEWPLQHPEKFKRLGIKPPRGILMFGPPGCSKTMIAKALATESQLNFLSIKGPELFSMWVGESERAVREVFRKARQVAPSIVFFDEIDAIGAERGDGAAGGSGSSVKERVLTQLLTEMDGVESLQNVTIVAATNRPDMIDKALLRPGRIDRIVYVGLPDAAARKAIFKIKLSAMPLSDNVDVQYLVEKTDGYSGAEIQAICHEAALKVLEKSFDSAQVSRDEFEYALKAVKPRTSSELLKLYQNYITES